MYEFGRQTECIMGNWKIENDKCSIAVLTEDGAFALFFRPNPGDLTAQESPHRGICHPRQKKC